MTEKTSGAGKSNDRKRSPSSRPTRPTKAGKVEEKEHRRVQRFVELVRSQMFHRK